MEEDSAASLAPHYSGHRERLRERFRKGGSAALADYEILELILFRAMPRRDVKPIAKALIARFGSYPEVLAARPERLEEVVGLGEAAITEIKIVEAAARRFAQASIEKRKNLGSTTAVIEYCRTAMAYLDREEFPVSWCVNTYARNWRLAGMQRSPFRAAFSQHRSPRLRGQFWGDRPSARWHAQLLMDEAVRRASSVS